MAGLSARSDGGTHLGIIRRLRAHGLITLASTGAGAVGRNKPPSRRAANKRASAVLKTWRILRKLHSCPLRTGQLVKRFSDFKPARPDEVRSVPPHFQKFVEYRDISRGPSLNHAHVQNQMPAIRVAFWDRARCRQFFRPGIARKLRMRAGRQAPCSVARGYRVMSNALWAPDDHAVAALKRPRSEGSGVATGVVTVRARRAGHAAAQERGSGVPSEIFTVRTLPIRLQE